MIAFHGKQKYQVFYNNSVVQRSVVCDHIICTGTISLGWKTRTDTCWVYYCWWSTLLGWKKKGSTNAQDNTHAYNTIFIIYQVYALVSWQIPGTIPGASYQASHIIYTSDPTYVVLSSATFWHRKPGRTDKRTRVPLNWLAHAPSLLILLGQNLQSRFGGGTTYYYQ